MSNTIAKDLNQLLADHQVFYQKLRGYHWNVTGPLFFALHEKFEELYNEAALRVDELAERVAALGTRPLSTLKEQLAASRIQEDDGAPNANDMVRNLHNDFESLTGWLRETAGVASDANDVATVNLVEGFADANDKTLWMLRAFLTE